MHITGKLLIFLLLLPLSATSVWMSAKLYVVRNSWSKQTEDLAKKNIDNTEQIAINERKLTHLKNDLSRIQMPWGRTWNDIDARGTVTGTKLELRAQLGSNQEISKRVAAPVLHAFSPNNAGGYSYLGPYLASTVRPQQSVLDPTWKYHTNDVLNLKQSKWRFRSKIASGYMTRMTQIDTRIDECELELRDLNISIVKQAELIIKSEESLKDRMAELDGDPGATEVPGEPEYSKGYVATIKVEQLERNATLNKLDEVRRQVKEQFDLMQSLIKENKQLASQQTSSSIKTPSTPAIANK